MAPPPPKERPSTLYIALCDTAAETFVTVIQRYFDAVRRGALPPFSGASKQWEFSRPVRVSTVSDWEMRSAKLDEATGTKRALVVDVFDREYPALLVTGVTGTGVGTSITSAHSPELPTIADPDIANAYRLMARSVLGGLIAMPGGIDQPATAVSDQLQGDEVVIGGQAELTVTLTAVARSQGEATRLADVTWTLLGHGAFRYSVEQQSGIAVTGMPAFGNESAGDDPDSKTPIYSKDVSVGVRGFWEDRPMRLGSLLAVLSGLDLVDP